MIKAVGTCVAATLVTVAGCTEAYKGVVRPAAPMSVLSPDLENLTDAKIEIYLKAQAKPKFPTALAVAKIAGQSDRRYDSPAQGGSIEPLTGDEAEGWRQLNGQRTAERVDQVQFVNQLLVGEKPTLRSLRDAAALLHAPLLLAYMQADMSDEGPNEAAIAYWTIVGLFTVPGNTVGHYTVCQGVIVDTRSGYILATVVGESKSEEKVLPGAVEIAQRRAARNARAEAIARLQQETADTIKHLAENPD